MEIASILYRQGEAARAEVTDFHGGIPPKLALHTQRPGQNLGHDRVVDEGGRQRPGSCLSGWRNVGLRQASKLEESGVVRSGAPAGLRRQRACGIRVEFTLQLRWQGDGREVLEFYVVSDAKAAANRHLSAPRRIIGKAHARTEVILVRLGIAKGYNPWNIGNSVQGLCAGPHWICPVLIAQS